MPHETGLHTEQKTECHIHFPELYACPRLEICVPVLDALDVTDHFRMYCCPDGGAGEEPTRSSVSHSP